MLINIPLENSVSQVMGYLKGESSLMMFDRYETLKYKYESRHFRERLLCIYSKYEQKANTIIYTESIKRR